MVTTIVPIGVVCFNRRAAQEGARRQQTSAGEMKQKNYPIEVELPQPIAHTCKGTVATGHKIVPSAATTENVRIQVLRRFLTPLKPP